MEKKVYIDGNLVVEHGNFYSRDIAACAGEEYKVGAKIITPPNGELRITEDDGSIFTYYYVKGEVCCYGIDDGNVYAFYSDHKITHNSYKNNIRIVERLMDEVEIPEGLKNIFYQQQFTSVFGALEYFLFDTFMWQVCNNYDIYSKVLSAHLRCLEYNNEIKGILRGEHNIKQERVFIEQTKEIVYHNTKKVSDLFSTAFDIPVDLGVLEDHISTRNDIVHRFGHTKKGNEVHVTKEIVLSLIAKIDIIVNDISKNINGFADKVAQ